VICAILRDFSKHGEKAVAEVRRKQPAAYLKICAWLVPREHKVEQTNTYEGLSTEQIEAYIAAIQDRLNRRAAGDQAKVIDGGAVETTAVATTTPLVLEPPKCRSNRLMRRPTPRSGRGSAGRESARCHCHRVRDSVDAPAGAETAEAIGNKSAAFSLPPGGHTENPVRGAA
jgi:hypothetical protein